MWHLICIGHCGKIHAHIAINKNFPTLSYVPISLCPKSRPSCADTITLLFSEWGRKDSKVLASQSLLWGSDSLQQRSAGTKHRLKLLNNIQCNKNIHNKIFLFHCNNLDVKYVLIITPWRLCESFCRQTQQVYGKYDLGSLQTKKVSWSVFIYVWDDNHFKYLNLPCGTSFSLFWQWE